MNKFKVICLFITLTVLASCLENRETIYKTEVAESKSFLSLIKDSDFLTSSEKSFIVKNLDTNNYSHHDLKIYMLDNAKYLEIGQYSKQSKGSIKTYILKNDNWRRLKSETY